MPEPTTTIPPPLKQPPGYRDPRTPSPPQLQDRKPVVLPPSFYHTANTSSSRRSCCRCLCCTLCLFLLLLLLLLFITCTLFYLWFTPRFPSFRLLDINHTKFNVTPSAKVATVSFLDSELIIRVEARNPNDRIVFYYGETTMTMTTANGEVGLGTARVPGFEQGARNVTVLRFVSRVKGQEIDEGVAETVARRVKSGTVKVDVEGTTAVGVGVGKVKVGMVGVNVVCGDVGLKDAGDGDDQMLPNCTISILKW